MHHSLNCSPGGFTVTTGVFETGYNIQNIAHSPTSDNHRYARTARRETPSVTPGLPAARRVAPDTRFDRKA